MEGVSQDSISRWVEQLLATVVILLVTVIGVVPPILESLTPHPTLKALELNQENFAYHPEEGNAVYIEIASLGLGSFNDQVTNSASPLVLLENGIPLTPHTLHVEIRSGKRGVFSHWGDRILFSPRAGDYRTNRYTLVFPASFPPLAEIIRPGLEQFWILAAIIATVLSVLLCVRGTWAASRYRLLFTALTAGFFFYHTIAVRVVNENRLSDWNSVINAIDTQTHLVDYTPESSRPPVYSWFAHFVSGVSGAVLVETSPPINESVQPPQDNPFLKIVRAQKIIFCLSATFMVWAVGALMPIPLVALTMMYLFSAGYLSAQYSMMMTEPLAQAWMFLIVGVFSLLLATSRSVYLFALALLCGLLVNTRSAGIYSVVFLMSGAAWCFYRNSFRRTILQVPLAIGCFLVLLFGPALYRYWKTDFFAFAPMYADARMAYALYLAQPEDIALMPDELSAQFLRECFEEKKKWAEDVRQHWSRAGINGGWAYLSSNLYLVAQPVARRLGIWTGKFGTNSGRDLFLRVSEPIIKKYSKGFLKICLSAFSEATSVNTRIHLGRFFTFWPLLLAALIASLLVFRSTAWFALTAIAGHLAHLVVIARYDQPLLRYVYATEPLVFLAFTILATGLLQQVVELCRKPEAVQSPATHPLSIVKRMQSAVGRQYGT